MATAYAAVVSVVHLMKQIHLYHAQHPIFLDEQLRLLASLHSDVAYLQDFLESYSRGDCDEAEVLEMQIAKAAYAAEEIIESYIVDHIHLRSGNNLEYKTSSSGGDIFKRYVINDIRGWSTNLDEQGSNSFSRVVDDNQSRSTNLEKKSSDLLSKLKNIRDYVKKRTMKNKEKDSGKSIRNNLDKTSSSRDWSSDLEENFSCKVDDIQSQPQPTDPEEKSFGRLSQWLQNIRDLVKKAMKNKEKDIARRNSNLFSRELWKTKEAMDFIKIEIVKIKGESKLKVWKSEDPVLRVGSLKCSLTTKDTVVVIEDELNQVLDMLTRDESNLQILPITGMGGIGKTTLAKNVYDSPFVVQCFDIRGWITVSQQYSIREILLGLVDDLEGHTNKNGLGSLEDHQLGDKLYKHLSGRKYLIIIDDMWSITAWDELRRFLPEYNNKSRIIVTTRLSEVADCFGSSDYTYRMSFLDESKSWNLLSRKVFGLERCPPELEEIGKQVAQCCKGLPLSISVIGGLLVNSNMTPEYWEYILSDINTTISLEDNARCLKILSMSYNHLPVHIKPCFLYLGIFPEDHEICVSKLIRLWVGENFLKPSNSKSLEEVAENYLKDLVDRNLIFVSKWGSVGNMKYCKIHDLLRELCLREVRKEKFLCVNMEQNADDTQELYSQRRIVINHRFSDEEHSFQIARALRSASFARSLICNSRLFSISLTRIQHDFRPPLNFKLLRMLDVNDDYPVEDVLQLVNSRYLKYRCLTSLFTYSDKTDNNTMIPSSISLLWNLQTLIIPYTSNLMTAPSELWEMPQLRHIMIKEVSLSDPVGTQDGIVLENLQTFSNVLNFRLTEDILQRIPNIKKLKVVYYGYFVSDHHLNNVGRLHKLQSLECCLNNNNEFIKNLEFPRSLKKLTLSHVFCCWEDITAKIGWLPNLEKLRLVYCRGGEEWNPVEGQFLCLKFLHITGDDKLVYWRAEETHFPRLEHLVLLKLRRLEEIPSGIGDIPTLQSIRLEWCSSSAIASAEKILEEQHELGNENFRVLLPRGRGIFYLR